MVPGLVESATKYIRVYVSYSILTGTKCRCECRSWMKEYKLDRRFPGEMATLSNMEMLHVAER